MISKSSILNNISELKSLWGDRMYKYRRNYRAYSATGRAELDSLKKPGIIGFNNSRELGEEMDTSPNPQINIIASCIDTLQSKIAQSKVRPFFNTINGSFKDIISVKQAQHFFDIFYDNQDVNRVVSDAFKDACIFDTGVIYINEEEKTIKKALPFQVYIRPAEANYGKITRVYYEQKDYPITALPNKIVEKFKNKSLQYVDFGIYYDIFNKVKAYTANGSFVCAEEYNSGALPFVFLYYKNPVIGGISTSVVDALSAIQEEINIIMAKIKDASQLNPALTFLLPEGSTMKAGKLNNRIGNVIQYRPNSAGGTPVSVSTPAFIDSEYLTLLDDLINKAYDIVGISQLSAQSRKPSGLNSGIALSTMEDVESDRFETQLNQIIKAYVQIAKICIQVFDQEENILPDIASRTNIKWKEIVKESKNMTIQYSGADSLSKDPSTKLQQLQAMAEAGIIPSSRVSQFMQLPDLEAGYSLSNNAVNAVMEVIKECVEEDNYDVPEYIPFELLKEEIINTQLALFSADRKKNKEDLQKLATLYETVEEMAAQWYSETEENAQQANEGIPYNQNVLESEANMVKTPQMAETHKVEKNNAAWVKSSDYDRV